MTESPRPRVIILGGGIGALTAAWHLTSDPAWKQRYASIDLYQPGWRLGGKCASSRNPQRGWRNEEHGLHMWFGFYENAFAMMRACYAERQHHADIARPDGAPLATFEQAFDGRDEVALMQPEGAAWRRLVLGFSHDDSAGEPGDGAYVEPGPQELMQRLLTMLWRQAENCMPGRLRWQGDYVSGLQGLEQAEAQWVDSPRESQDDALLHLSGLFDFLPPLSQLDDLIYEELGEAFERVRVTLRQLMEPGPDPDTPGLSEIREMLELGFTVLRGMIADRVPQRGLGSIDHLELRQWLHRHGASHEVLACTPLRALYSATLAYEDGDLNRPNMAAGVALGLLLRIGVCWRGHAMYEMQAGMGETVIAPLYQVLEKRGVKFHFFHRVRALELDPQDRQRVGRVRLGIQATVPAGSDTYRPLIAVGKSGLPCWPREPLYEQLHEGGPLREKGIDLESEWSGWEDVAETSLEIGAEDELVLGISLGGLAPVCEALRDNSVAWDLMLREIPVVETQSAQLWLNRSLQQLGWRGGIGAMVAAPEPHNVWADMSQVIATEDWGERPPVASVYLCGPLAGNFSDAAASDTETPRRALAAVRTETIRWLQNYAGWVWPAAIEPHRAAHPGERPYDWMDLYVQGGRDCRSVACLDEQWLCANIGGSERYVLSPARHNQRRLPPDRSGFRNLKLAGDWTRTSINAGCVEAAVMSGMAASRAICGWPAKICNEFFLTNPPEQAE
ncbi:hypothetical protein D0B54_22875 [Solimonas sp. K1W22B-7]|uniref:NAD(P)-binding protein n=1 Tax=Solimonas sp. K1W22B-7 TaxID=2303331 RepID=UPI000E3302FF|nr:NAD(P)-binding protein [Solimonas sp. K1W22B-7]AXQ31352.1 hypothetical protein D0B54_22875 [Solimonas sp. K1W22B-7]